MTWLAGLVRRRWDRMAITAAGIALAVGLLASIGTFLSASKATMTRRAVTGLAVDWQVEVRSDADAGTVAAAVASFPGVDASEPVLFASTSGLHATVAGTTQTSGPGVVLGLGPTYVGTFPDSIRPLVGATRGVLLAQQTAANLHAGPGDVIQIGRDGLPSVGVTVEGVVDLPQADSLFQSVGSPSGASPQAPPDNVVLLPTDRWHQAFDPLVAARPDLAHSQIHARLDHHLPPDPAAAYAAVLGKARNLEARLAGAGVVGDNIGARLAAARSDALYAQVLFLFLGLPGAALAGLLTAIVAAAGAARRRREQGLLRARGATVRQLVALAAVEAAVVGMAGSGAGLVVAWAVGRSAFGTAGFGATGAATAAWWSASVVIGVGLAALAVVVPAWRDARALTVTAARRTVGRSGAPPVWQRVGLDVMCLAGGALVFWLTSRNGYTLVLAPEGVPTISVSYWALAGPALVWIGAGLLAYRAATALLRWGRRPVAVGMRLVAGGLADTVAATMQRQRRMLARSVALLSVALAFAASTAVFNSTYRHQADVDAFLTNGADVTVTPVPGAGAGASERAAIAATPGVRSVEAIQHRFAYVGNDLQDLYGVDPATIVRATKLQDAYFAGGSARSVMDRLAAQPDAVLVSAETVKDFQLQPGDELRLRLQDARTKQYTEVPFHYAGVAKEFPTAPRDSFLVANADYVARATGSDAVGAFLVDTGGRDITAVADRLRHQMATTATVTDLVTSRGVIGSSLTAVDLAGLTRVELGFAVALAVAAGGLVLWLGFAERRRTLAIAAALGARRRQLAGFVWGEAGFVTVVGFITGAVTGAVLSAMLVKVLTGVFDPPPDALAVPWRYLLLVALASLGAIAAAAHATVIATRRPTIELLRDL